MNARDEPNKTNDMVLAIACVDGARNACKETARFGPVKNGITLKPFQSFFADK
jgi:hypothetical protein